MLVSQERRPRQGDLALGKPGVLICALRQHVGIAMIRKAGDEVGRLIRLRANLLSRRPEDGPSA